MPRTDGPSETQQRRHFSMVRSFHLADLLTIAHGFCGVAAIFQAMTFVGSQERSRLYVAALLVPVAGCFDLLDGRVARWRHEASPMGRELDSLADVISFGVAPASIAFAAGLQSGVDQLILLYFVGCGVSRLARYNITAEALAARGEPVRYFEGTPIPTGIVPLGILLLVSYLGRLSRISVLGLEFHLVSLLFFVSGSLMISRTLRIPKP
jgi:CDP-diacylglycerol--serine O-phosphatidyltransferase